MDDNQNSNLDSHEFSQDSQSSEASSGNGFDFNAFVPDEYKDKTYLKPIADAEAPATELFKQFDNLQSLLGKRGPSIPTDESTDAQRSEFYKALGVPASADAYNLEPIKVEGENAEKLNALLNNTANADVQKAMRESFHKHNLTPEQAKGLHEDYHNIIMETQRDALTEATKLQETLDKEFDVLAKEQFGADHEAKIGQAKQLLDQFVPDSLKTIMTDPDQMSNTALIAVASALNGMVDEYVNAEDASSLFKHQANNTGQVSFSDASKYRKDNKAAYTNQNHPDHKRVYDTYMNMLAQANGSNGQPKTSGSKSITFSLLDT